MLTVKEEEQMNDEQLKIVARLQDNLYTIRQLAGWSADQMGRLLDVTKQTVYNLERGKPKMSWAQYLAVRKILDLEIERQPDNVVLPKAVAVLLDDEELPMSRREELQEELRTIAKGMVSRSVNRKIALKLADQTVDAATARLGRGELTGSRNAGISAWLEIARAGQE